MRRFKNLFGSAALLAGPGASGPDTGDGQRWRSTRLFVGLLRLRALRLRAQRFLRTGIFLQRHLPWHGPMGRLGLRQRLGQPSLRRWRRRELSRQRRGSGGSWSLWWRAGSSCGRQSRCSQRRGRPGAQRVSGRPYCGGSADCSARSATPGRSAWHRIALCAPGLSPA
jgi:hypothetical protein